MAQNTLRADILALAAPDGTLPMYVDGAWTWADGGQAFDTLDPTTEERITAVAAGGGSDVDRAVAAAEMARHAWATSSWTERSKRLVELARRLRAHVEELAMLDVEDAGLPITGMRADVTSAASELEYFAGIASELKGFTVPTHPDLLAYSVREPYGVVGRIIPFNHPLKFAAGKVAAPLAAGNAVVLKPPEQAPLSALALARLSEDLLPPGVLNVVTGLGADVGGAIAAHPRIPRVAFTGSVPTGRAVMRAAAEHIKHVTLELGGKNPMIVCDDADPARTAAAAIAGMNFRRSTGQSCQSNSRVFVHRSVRDDFLAALADEVAGLTVGDPRDDATDMGPVAFADHHARVMAHIESAREDGAKLVHGGGRPDHLPRGYFVEPTVFSDVTPDMRLAQDEVFGPVMAVMDWDDEERLFETINDVEYGLTARIWTRDVGRAQRFVSRVESGLVWVNGSGGKPAGIPFGGYKLSGLGKEGGLEELISYTHEKGVISAPHDR